MKPTIGFGVLVASNWIGYLAGGAGDTQDTFLFTVIPGVVMWLLRRTIRDVRSPRAATSGRRHPLASLTKAS